jgi:hypothetical protein
LRYQPTYPDQLTFDKSPALYAFGTLVGVQPLVSAMFCHQPCARPTSLGSRRESHVPPSSQRSVCPSW